MSTLVVGATGILGSKICARLRGAGNVTRALVRETSQRERVEELEKLGVELCTGDLKSPGTLEPALQGVRTVISTASSTLSRVDGDTIESVDLRGQLQLIDAAKGAQVEQFVFVSFQRHPLEFPLQTAKRAVENQLISSGISYTIFQPVHFTEVWLSPIVGFDLLGGNVRVLGNGTAKTTWISVDDVATFVAGAVGNPKARDRIFPLGGPEQQSQLDVVELFRRASGRSVRVQHQPEAELRTAFEAASDPLAHSFAALMLATAIGQIASSAAALDAIPVKLKPVHEFLQLLLKQSAP
ncbi:MAG TPA: SDR family oxidoreductase [Polyangiaceae bacterium]|nr:SDR family oxidoreductase [Polyangiaceae bacterium]